MTLLDKLAMSNTAAAAADLGKELTESDSS
jgi:hypothetical protein